MNNILIEAFETMRAKSTAEKEPFKVRAYQAVILQLQAHPSPIHTWEDIQHFKLGEKTTEKIKEILETGRLAAADRAKQQMGDSMAALKIFQQIYGVGPAKATELVQKGFRTIDDLRRGSPPLNEKQQIGLQYYEDLLNRIPRKEMDRHRDTLRILFPQSDIVGSYRRGLADSGDIDVLVRVPKGTPPKIIQQQLVSAVQQMKQGGYILEILALGAHKCMAICRFDIARRLDILMTPEEEYPCALLYFTGSDRFNVAFRQIAMQDGYTLNEHALTPTKMNVPPVPAFKDERDIFRFLRIEYVEPTKRTETHTLVRL